MYKIFISLLLFIFLNNHSFADEYSVARKKFVSGDIQNTSKILKTALNNKKITNTKILEESKKLLAICLYLLGDINGAEQLFNNVLRFNNKAQLNPRDLLDPSIKVLFDKLKSQANANIKPQTYSNTESKIMPKKMIANFTGLIVKSNTKRSVIMSDGIFVGTANEQIAISPGNHEITVASDGYLEFNKSYNFESGKTIKITVNLKKPEEMQIAQNKKPQIKAPTRSISKIDLTQDLPKTNPNNLQQEFAPKAQPQYQQPQYQQPQYQQPQYQQPQVQQPQVQQPQVQQPQVQQPQVQPQYQQPQYQQPQVQPQYQQPQYQQPQYQQPQYQQPQYQQPQYQQPQVQHVQNNKSHNIKTKNAKSSKNMLITLTPLAGGQFQNQQYFKGLLLLGAEAGAIYYAVSKLLQENNEYKESQKGLEELENKNADTEEYEKSSNERLKSIRNQQIIGWAGFTALWLIGVIDALANFEVNSNKISYQINENSRLQLKYEYINTVSLEYSYEIR